MSSQTQRAKKITQVGWNSVKGRRRSTAAAAAAVMDDGRVGRGENPLEFGQRAGGGWLGSSFGLTRHRVTRMSFLNVDSI